MKRQLLRFALMLMCLLLLPLCAPAEEKVTVRISAWLDESEIMGFMEQNPGIEVVIDDSFSSSVQTDLITGSPVDIITVQAAGTYQQMIEKGYAAPIENAALVEMAKRMFPGLQDVLFQNGVLYAVPRQLDLIGWTIDETGWQEAGFTLDEEPETLEQFLQCYEQWLDRAGDFPETYFFEGGSLEYLVSVLVRQYIAGHETADEAITFSDPAFRAALDMLNNARPLFQADEERLNALMSGDLYAMPLIYNYATGVYGYTGFDSHTVRTMMIPALNADVPPFVEGEAWLLVVNAGSKHPEEAALLLQYLLEQWTGRYADFAYNIFSDLTEPRESPYFQPTFEQYTQELADNLMKQETCAPDEKLDLQERQQWLEDWFARQDDIRWSISPRDIALQRSLLENLKIPFQSLYLASDSNCRSVINTLISRFAAGEISADTFIDELNRTCRLAFGEQ